MGDILNIYQRPYDSNCPVICSTLITIGSGFTGVLISADCRVVRLLCDVGAPPACPVGSGCTGVMTPYGMSGGSNQFYGNPLGAVAVIPTNAIACFTHNAI